MGVSPAERHRPLTPAVAGAYSPAPTRWSN